MNDAVGLAIAAGATWLGMLVVLFRQRRKR